VGVSAARARQAGTGSWRRPPIAPARSAAITPSRSRSHSPADSSCSRAPIHIGCRRSQRSQNCSGVVLSCVSWRSVTSTAPCGSSSVSSTDGSPQSTGAGERLSVWRIREAAANIGPRGAQVVMTTRPPGRTTRPISAADRAAGRAKITPKTEIAASNCPSSNGSCAASPCTNSADGTRWRATSSSRGEPVEPGRDRAAALRREGGIARAARDVEHALVAGQAKRRDRNLSNGRKLQRRLGVRCFVSSDRPETAGLKEHHLFEDLIAGSVRFAEGHRGDGA